MFVGDTGAYGKLVCLFEVVGNAVDEFLGGRCKSIDISLEPNGAFTVTDDGGGIRPTVDLESALLNLHSTPSVEPGRPHRHVSSFSALGLAVPAALAEKLHIVSRGTNVMVSRGKIVPAPDVTAPERGTRVSFVPDPEIFEDGEIAYDDVVSTLRGTCAILRDLEIHITRSPIVLRGAGGLRSLLPRGTWLAPPFEFRELCDGTTIDVCAAWSKFRTSTIRSYANLQPTQDGGTHVEGFDRAVRAALDGDSRAVTHLSLVISVDRDAITYAGPTRGKLGSPEICGIVKQALSEPLRAYFAGPGRPVVDFSSSRRRSPAVGRARTSWQCFWPSGGHFLCQLASRLGVPSRLQSVTGTSASLPAISAAGSAVVATRSLAAHAAASAGSMRSAQPGPATA